MLNPSRRSHAYKNIKELLPGAKSIEQEEENKSARYKEPELSNSMQAMILQFNAASVSSDNDSYESSSEQYESRNQYILRSIRSDEQPPDIRPIAY